MSPTKRVPSSNNQESARPNDAPPNTDDEKKKIAESIVATMPVALLVLEADLRVRIASQTFYDTFEALPETTECQLVYDLGNGQWNIPKLRILLEDILPHNQIFIGYEVEHTFERIGRRTMLLNGRRLDNVQLILLVIVDITERKQIEEALQASHERLETTLAQLQKMQAQLIQQERLAAVGGLAAGIAHDFNNILSIIMLNVELGLHTPELPPKLRSQLETIAQQTKRSAHLVQQILDFGRRTVLTFHPLDLVSVLKAQVELLQLAIPNEIKVTLTYGSDAYRVNGDPTHMQQMLTNLALNALDAMREGGELGMNLERFRLVSRDAAPLPGMELGDWIQIAISDTGTGIPWEVKDLNFEPFFTTKAPSRGTGLGLAQVYGIVQQHHGHIHVQTQEGAGTTFFVYLPAI